ncbi:unnamed protein product [Paramecium sonneborni]|uniref:Uncharacterized protein n=1 Tax=Paramecium sonneborni TaxID=65129 RepID=A0A8S1RR08_9CILI|nr:unnamed protein product [Paramecium sonneborni]
MGFQRWIALRSEKIRRTQLEYQMFTFSKLQNSFISGSNDNTIRCWKQLNGQERNSLQLLIELNVYYYVKKRIHYFLEMWINQLKYGKLISIIIMQNGKDWLSYFELINGDFVEQKEKEQQLIISSDVYNLNLLPIVFNKEKEIILIRHKFHVYLLTKQTQGRYQISTKLKFQNNSIYGIMTIDAKYIILWEKTEQNFQIYQIEYQ